MADNASMMMALTLNAATGEEDDEQLLVALMNANRNRDMESVNHVTPSACIFFHTHHGRNISIINQGTVAQRTKSFAHALCFSSRPLNADEVFTVRINKQQSGWTGHLRIGLTSLNPNDQFELPQYMMPDLLRQGRTWGFAVTATRYPSLDTAAADSDSADSDDQAATDVGSTVGIYYTVHDGACNVHMKVNGLDLGVQQYGLSRDPSASFYAVVDVYGATSQVQIVHAGVPALLELCRKSLVHRTCDFSLLPIPKRLKDYLRTGA